MNHDLAVIRSKSGYDLEKIASPVGPQIQNLIDVLIALCHHQRMINGMLDVLIGDPMLPLLRDLGEADG